VDTSIRCDSARFKAFEVVDVLLILVYQTLPLIWAVFLWRERHRLQPVSRDPAKALSRRNADPALAPLKFLFEPCVASAASTHADFRCTRSCVCLPFSFFGVARV